MGNVKTKTSRRAPVSAAQHLRSSLLRNVERRVAGRGSIMLPCIPSLLESHKQRLLSLFRALGRALSEAEQAGLHENLERGLSLGFARSPHSQLVISYEANPAPRSTLEYQVHLHERSVEDYYAAWSETAAGVSFGAHADAKVLALARQLPARARVLDVGAGHGRNALALCREGLSVDALELVPALCEKMAERARDQALVLTILRGDVLAADLTLEAQGYALVVLSEVVSHFRDREQLRRALAKLTLALIPGGYLLLNAFLTAPGYAPDRLAYETSQVALSSVFTRAEFAAICSELGLEPISEEEACAYERAHLPNDNWPPTPWFVSWAEGRNIFDLPSGPSPIALHWLVYRKAATREPI